MFARTTALASLLLMSSPCLRAQTVPLSDMGSQTYLGFTGGLYAAGVNAPPPAHASLGVTRSLQVVPRDAAGNPSPAGRVVLLSIGMSNTTQEFCAQANPAPCDAWTFSGQAALDGSVNHATLRIVNGAAAGKAASSWDSPTDPDYDRVRDSDLVPAGLTEAQVQAVWLKVANAGPTVHLPASGADAYTLETQIGNIVRALRTRYPNLKLVYVSSRIYAGYATTTLNPEPYAYESGFAVKWLVQAQIDQMAAGGTIVDARAGDLNAASGVPWVAWGPYLWANGTTPRADGLTWSLSEFESDGTHPGQPAEQKVGTQLLNFFKTDPTSVRWFMAPPIATKLRPMVPCRAIDTRSPSGPLAGPALSASSSRPFMLLGTCGISAAARAISANVTVILPTSAGDLRLGAAGQPIPSATAISYGSGQVRANNAVIGLGGSQDFFVFCAQPTGTVDLVVDVNGTFE